MRLAVGDSVELQVELVNGLWSYNDSEAAILWAVRYDIPHDRLPYDLSQLVRTNNYELSG